MNSPKPLRYWVELGGTRYPAREVRGEEAICQPFRLEARFALNEIRALDPEGLIETSATILLERGTSSRAIGGIATDISVSATRTGAPEARVLVEPEFALTRFRQDIRVFRDKSVPDIVVEVLAGYGISPELRLQGSYAPRPYCVQFRETDFDFVSRLLEDEGICYFFVGGQMVLGDGAAAYDAGPSLPFRSGSGLDQDEAAIVEFGEMGAFMPGQVTLRDFNPEHPSLNMDVQAAGATPGGPEYYDYPGEYLTPGEGQGKVRLRAEAYACAARGFAGRSFSGQLVPGATFTLEGAPAGLADGSYVVTRLVHDWHVAHEGFVIELEALSGSTAFRPRPLTPAPTITNPMVGYVTGPPGEDIHTDPWGRVKVHFPWDRLQPKDDNCSDWVPILQDNTGHSCSIVRVGWEVICHYLEGDPDRPVVAGRVYNPLDPPFVKLPDNKTRSTITSLSSPREEERGGTGRNFITFEDLAGRELLSWHAQKDQNIVVANDKNETVLDVQNSVIERDEQVSIGNDHDATIADELTLRVDGDYRVTIGGNRDWQIGGALGWAVDGNRAWSIGGMHFRRIGEGDSATAAKQHTETVGGVILEASLKDNSARASKVKALLVGGAHVEIAKSSKSEAGGKARAELIGGAYFVKADGKVGLRANKSRATTVGGMLSITSTKEMTITGKEKVTATCGAGTVEAAEEIKLKVGDCELVLKEDVINLTAPSEVTIDVTGDNTQGTKEASLI